MGGVSPVMPHHASTPDSSWEPNEDSFGRYLAGESSETERNNIASWLLRHPGAAQQLAAVREAAQLHVTEEDTVSAAYVTERFWTQVGASSNENHPFASATELKDREGFGTSSAHQKSHLRSWMRTGIVSKYVGALAAGFVLMAGWSFLQSHLSQPSVAQNSNVHRYSTSNGQRSQVELSDGTIVHLSVGSQLDVPSNFGVGTRRVRLRGQAVFHVIHAAGTPFVIDAQNTVTSVLGTEFGVRAYDSDTVVRVSVLSGRVSVNEAILQSHTFATVNRRGMLQLTPAQDVSGDLAFAHGILSLHKVSLREAIPDLQRWFDVTLVLDYAEFGDIVLDAELTTSSRADLLESLRAVIPNVRIVTIGRTITLSRFGSSE